MSKCLITGCGGFVGSHLAEFLLEIGLTAYGLVHHDSNNLDHLRDRLTIIRGDILDKDRVAEILTEVRPDYVFHLAAQSLITTSWQDPEKTLKINTLGTLYLLEGIRKACLDPSIEVMGSSAEYGLSTRYEVPIKETNELYPSNPYGVSKVAQDMLVHLYWRTYGMKIICVRPFFVIGPRKTSDACSDFARGIAEIEAGKKDSLNVGNLETVRDFLDIRDAVKAMWLLISRGTPGEVYNICSGKGYMIRDILDKILSLSKKPVKVHLDPGLMRPSDEPVRIGDNAKLRQLGWEPQIPIEQSLSHTLDYWRAKMQC